MVLLHFDFVIGLQQLGLTQVCSSFAEEIVEWWTLTKFMARCFLAHLDIEQFYGLFMVYLEDVARLLALC